MVPVVWATFGIFSAWSKWFSVANGDRGGNLVISLWPGDEQQSTEWRHSGSPRPKKFRVQKSAGNFSPRFFWDQDGILLIYYLPKGQTIKAEYYSSLLVQLKDILKENPAGRTTRGSCSCTTMPRLTEHLQPRRNWPTWASSVSINHPILRIWPRWTTTCSLDWKNWKLAIFRPTRGSLLPRRPGWTDNLLIFFWVASKSESKGLRSVMSFAGSMLNKSRVWSL